jgi:hypothetical protein
MIQRSKNSSFLAGFLLGICLFAMMESVLAFDRQSNADYHVRREALAKKAAGVVVLFAATENDGPNDLYGFRQDDDFYYLSGLSEPGSALLIASALEAKGDTPSRSYTEILFLPPRNSTQEKWTGPKLGAENPEAAKLPASIASKRWDSCPSKSNGS